MNRRLVIVDDDPATGINPAEVFGYGITEPYTISELLGDKKNGIPARRTDQELDALFGTLGPGDGVLLVGPKAFPFLQRWFHFGIRGENYYDCSRLKRVGTSGGFFIKTLYHETDLPLSRETVDFFLSPQFTEVRQLPNLNYRVVHDYQKSLEYLNYIYSLPIGTEIGFDYEGSGMAFDRKYRITGAALALKGGNVVFFSFTDIEKNSSPEEWQDFLERFKAILVKYEKNIWVYNAGYEAQVTWRTFGVELDFRDASVFNYIQGLNSKRYSLKITVQRILGGGTEKAPYLQEIDHGGILPWDTEFDDLEDRLDKMFYEVIPGKTKKDTTKQFKCDIGTYRNTPEWADICARYPDYIPDFCELIEDPRNFGNPFCCIPSEILGKYCCLDAFYTLMIPLELEGHYSQICVDTYQGNLSLGQKLTRGGLYINEDFRMQYDKYCDDMMLYGIIYPALYVTKLRMNKHLKKANKLSSYSQICQVLLKREEFHKGDPMEITKTLLSKNIDENNSTQTGLDEGRLAMVYGAEFAEWLVDTVKDAMTETKFKGKIDASITRKKKILGVISEKLAAYLRLDQINLGKKHEELEKYLYYEKGYKLLKYINSQILDPNNMPEMINFGGQAHTKPETTKFVMEGYFRCTSPIDNDDLTKLFFENFRQETVFLATIGKEKNKLPGEKKYYQNLGINNPSEALAHFQQERLVYMETVNNFYNGKMNSVNFQWPAGAIQNYPTEIWSTSQEYDSKILDSDATKDIWNSWKGYDIQDDFFGVSAAWEELKVPFSESIFTEDPFFQMRIILIRSLLFKKYNKIKTTYVGGLFCANSKYVIDTPALMPLRDADPNEPGAVKKSFVKAEVLLKETKRWSSPFHVIPSHQDSKACITTPTLVDPQTGKKTATFLSYFDISSAEVRSLFYKSGDANGINLFETGQDVYIHTAKAHLGEAKWNSLSKGEQKAQRKIFKVVFLAVAYRMSAKTLGENLNVPENTAQALIDTLFNEFPTLKEFILRGLKYPEEHDGLIETFLGDHLQCRDWIFRHKIDKFGKRVVDKAKLAKLERASINYKIQNYSAVSLANGFNNVQIRAKEEGILAKNVIVVHDSCENYVSINHLFEILEFYNQEFMEFCYKHYGIRFMFDLEIGTDYANMLVLHQESPTEISLSGSGSTLREMLRRIFEESDLQVEVDTPYEALEPHWIEDSIERFVSDRQCCMVKDTSKYTVKLRKIC